MEYKALWNTRLQPRFSIFMWRVLHQRLAVGAEFLKLGIFKYPFCAHCEEEIETIDHMFIHCEPASIIWSWVKVSFDVSLPLFSLADLWKFVIQVQMRTEKILLVATVQLVLYYLWKARNERRFQDAPVRVESILRRVQRWVFINSFVEKNIREAVDEDVLDRLNIPVNQTSRCKVVKIQWVPPIVGVVKLNTDGVFQENSRRAT